jgi:hypothetical protein
MKNVTKILAVLVVGSAFGVFLMSAQQHQMKMGMGGTHLEGTLVDTKCYTMMPDMNAGMDHKGMGADGKMMEVKGCAKLCAKMGIPVALLEKGGKTHVLAAPANQIANYMAQEVKIDGQEMGGVFHVDKLQVKQGGGWKEVKLTYPMSM